MSLERAFATKYYCSAYQLPIQIMSARSHRWQWNFTCGLNMKIAGTALVASLAGMPQEVERWTRFQTKVPMLKADTYAAEEANPQLSLAAQTLANDLHPHEQLRRETGCCYNQ